MLLLIAATLLAAPAEPKLGVGLEGIGGRGLEFVDVMKTSRAWEKPGSGPAKTDASGWPVEDARTVVFDMRPTMAWAPPMDDPDGYQIDVSGRYSVSFKGKADLAAADNIAIENQKYADGTTTADLVVPKGKALVVLSFLHTNQGVKDVRILRPGYPRDTKQTFSTPFLNAVKPFPVLRFMDWLDSNGTNPFFGDAKNTTEWSDRHVPSDATFERQGRKFGVPWEYVIRLANEANKDIWINIPVAASDDYVRELAKMMKRDLHPGAKIYLEYSNEVWNWGFLQSTYNRMAAEAEVKAGSSNLNNDGEKNWDVWRRRRHARRTIEIGRIFTTAFGASSFGTQIRPVMAWWVIAPDQYLDMLEWVQRTYGAPSKVLYAIAGAPYFNTEKAGKTATVDQILDALAESSSQSAMYRSQMIGLAQRWNLKAFCYEGGPDSGGGSPINIANRIRAQRHPRMKDLVRYDLDQHWYKAGGGLFMYFTLTSAYSRYGMWGLSDDVTKTDTPKWQAVREILGRP